MHAAAATLLRLLYCCYAGRAYRTPTPHNKNEIPESTDDIIQVKTHRTACVWRVTLETASGAQIKRFIHIDIAQRVKLHGGEL